MGAGLASRSRERAAMMDDDESLTADTRGDEWGIPRAEPREGGENRREAERQAEISRENTGDASGAGET